MSKIDTGPEYEESVRTGAEYWRLVLAGKDATAAKAASDAALSRLLGCSAQVAGRKLGLRERISRAIKHDTAATGNQG